MVWLTVAKPLLKILSFGVTIPVGVILAAGLWVHFDKTSTIRSAVDRAVTELVTGAELEAERAKNVALERIVSELQGQADALKLANERFSENLKSVQSGLEDANEELRELAATPVSELCVVEPDLLERLLNN